MSFIKVINYENAKGKLKKIYDRIKGPNNHIDHVLTIHSLRPHTLEGHMALYKSVLHHTQNTLPKWYLETIGAYISQLNHCDYCKEHHAVGIQKNLNDPGKYNQILTAMQTDDFSKVLDEKFSAGMAYAIKLTNDHHNITKTDIEKLRKVGLTDGEILEINQVTAYFNYVNRSVVGLGVTLEDGNIGLSPSSDEEGDWGHV